jgi:two-component system, OmpR family, sensor histidine kinase CpxA
MTLYLRTFGWVVFNLVLLVLIGFGVFWFQRRLPLDSLLADPGGRQLQTLAASVAGVLVSTPDDRWPATLEAAERTWNVQLTLLRPDGSRVAGSPAPIPEELRIGLADSRIRAPEPAHRGPDGIPRLPPPPWGHFAAPPAEDGVLYAAVRIPVRESDDDSPQLALLVRIDPVRGGSLLFDLRPLLVAALVVVAVSAAVWWPFAHRIVTALDRVIAVTDRIATGRLDARVPIGPGGEIGRLGQAVNQMAERLEGNAAAQRRFLRDVAHELSSPIARMQMALEVEGPAPGTEGSALAAEIATDVAVLRERVEELLAYSRATEPGLGPRMETLDLEPLVRSAVAQELGSRLRTDIEVPSPTRVLGDPQLIQRAVANLLRNSLRHAGPEATVRIGANADGEWTELRVVDNGPGVPGWALERLGEPFFRVDPSRDRKTGGSGLGLSLVVSAISACGGHVAFRNADPGGFEARIRLRKAS